MEEPRSQYSIRRKPVPGTAPTLSLSRSHSTLWRPWSPKLSSFVEYERSLYKFPWLDNACAYEDIEGGYAPCPRVEMDEESQSLVTSTNPENQTPSEDNDTHDRNLVLICHERAL